MRIIRVLGIAILGASMLAPARLAVATVVINEIVKEQRTAGAGAVTNDPREFVELYNAGETAVDISGWTLTTQRIDGTLAAVPGSIYFTDVIQNGVTLQPGEYYVMGKIGGLGTLPPGTQTQDLGSGVELWEDLRATIMELRRGPYMEGPSNSPLEDGVAYDTFRAHNPPPAGVTFYTPTAEQLAETGNGVWGQAQSYDIPETTDFKQLSIGRYRDGRDTNSNGRDFGFIPLTPGASNNVPDDPDGAHTAPNVESLSAGADVTNYHYGFVPAKVIDVTAQSTYNPSVISGPAPGQNKAITVWDTTGGGNSAYSKDIVTSFDIHAYLDATPLAITSTDWEAEWTAYGIGTTEPLFGTPNQSALITTGTTLPTNTQNSSTGIGWLYTRMQRHPNDGGGDVFKLQLVDFGEGGNSVPGKPNTEWTIIDEFDLTGTDTGWHRLSIDYDPATGDVVAMFDDEVINFDTMPDLLGTFYVGYREGLTAVPGANVGRSRPPTFVQFVETALAGDHNGDGVVDLADYVAWRKNPGAFGGDPDGYDDWRQNFGAGSSGSGGRGAVPEPGAMGLVVFGLMGLALRKPWRQ
jgi:hypothetical protein